MQNLKHAMISSDWVGSPIVCCSGMPNLQAEPGEQGQGRAGLQFAFSGGVRSTTTHQTSAGKHHEWRDGKMGRNGLVVHGLWGAGYVDWVIYFFLIIFSRSLAFGLPCRSLSFIQLAR
jgi:hypothetical protein